MTVGIRTGGVEASAFERVFVGIDASVGLVPARNRYRPHLQVGPLLQARVTWRGRLSLGAGAMVSYRGTNFLVGTVGGDLEALAVFDPSRSGLRLGLRGHGLLNQVRVSANLGQASYASFDAGLAVDRSIADCHGCVDYKLY